MRLSVLLAAVGLALAAPAYAQPGCLESDAYQLGLRHNPIPAACASDSSYLAAYREGDSAGSDGFSLPAAMLAGAAIDHMLDNNHHHRHGRHGRGGHHRGNHHGGGRNVSSHHAGGHHSGNHHGGGNHASGHHGRGHRGGGHRG